MKNIVRKYIKVGLIIVIILACVFTARYAGAVTTSSPKPMFTIVLDAGHGGIDGGVVGVNGSKESEMNLAMTFSLKQSLESAGFKVVMTRSSQAGLYGIYGSGFKKRDMNKRKEIIDEAKPDLVISVHMNSFPSDRGRRGAQVFYKIGSQESKNLSSVIQNRLNSMEESVKKGIILQGDYFILNCTHCPAVLIECGFISNAEDEKLLGTASYRDKFSQVVTMAVVEYYAAAKAGNVHLK